MQAMQARYVKNGLTVRECKMSDGKREKEKVAIEDEKAVERAEAVARAEAEAQRISKATVRAEALLAGLLEWVGKTDGRTAFLFAVNTALGGLALSYLANSDWSVFEVLAFAAYFALFGLASLNLVLVQYPNVVSPNRSMLFFGTIAGNPSDEFIVKFSSINDDEYLRDVLHQCHVNSQIVSKKFSRLQKATRYLIASSFVWLLVAAVPAARSQPAQAFLGQLFSGKQQVSSIAANASNTTAPPVQIVPSRP